MVSIVKYLGITFFIFTTAASIYCTPHGKVVVIICCTDAYFKNSFECGPYGFICERNNKLRLCEGDNLFGPPFICPPNTICNEDSSDVCENTVNYIDPSISKTIRCRRNERIADTSVPGCKGYILCIPNKNRFQGIKFRCSGSTVFNGYTRTCSSPEKYKCPLTNTTINTLELYKGENSRMDPYRDDFQRDNTKPATVHHGRPIDCKNYKFRVTQDKNPVRAAFFCPPRPIVGQSTIRCTIFSNQFCITLERYEEDQFTQNAGTAYRRPRFDTSTKY